MTELLIVAVAVIFIAAVGQVRYWISYMRMLDKSERRAGK
jgi:hypothetical protein